MQDIVDARASYMPMITPNTQHAEIKMMHLRQRKGLIRR